MNLHVTAQHVIRSVKGGFHGFGKSLASLCFDFIRAFLQEVLGIEPVRKSQ